MLGLLAVVCEYCMVLCGENDGAYCQGADLGHKNASGVEGIVGVVAG